MSRTYEALSEEQTESKQESERTMDENVVTTYEPPPPLSLAQEAEHLKRAVARATPRMPGTRLRFRQDGKGEYVAIRDGKETPVPYGTRMTADIRGMRDGFVRFSGPGIAPAYAVALTLSNEDPIKRDDLSDNDKSRWPIGLSRKQEDPWKPFVHLPMYGLDGELFAFQMHTLSGVPAITEDFLKDCDRPGRYPQALPIVSLQRSFFPNSYNGETPKPLLKLVEWISRDDLRQLTGDVEKTGTGDAPSWMNEPDDPGYSDDDIIR